MKKPILITGAAGFIGSNLTRYLVKKRFNVNIIIRKSSDIWRLKDILDKLNIFYADLSEKKKIRNIIKIIKPKTIFHLAAHGAYSDQKDSESIKNAVFDSTINLINECKKYNFSAFINTGSSSEYGFKNKAMKESDILKPNSYYSAFKSACSLFCQYESINSNVHITTVRPFHVYGPFERQSRLIPTLINNMLQKKNVKLVSPNISRDLIYINDLIDFYLLIAKQKKLRGEILNLGSGKRTTIKEIYDKLSKITNYDIKNNWGSMKNRYWDQTIWYADNSYVKKKFNWKPKVTLNKGLEETVKWYKENYKKS